MMMMMASLSEGGYWRVLEEICSSKVFLKKAFFKRPREVHSAEGRMGQGRA
jgi:hypothetical protein